MAPGRYPIRMAPRRREPGAVFRPCSRRFSDVVVASPIVGDSTSRRWLLGARPRRGAAAAFTVIDTQRPGRVLASPHPRAQSPGKIPTPPLSTVVLRHCFFVSLSRRPPLSIAHPHHRRTPARPPRLPTPPQPGRVPRFASFANSPITRSGPILLC